MSLAQPEAGVPADSEVSREMASLVTRVHEILDSQSRDLRARTLADFDPRRFAAETGFSPRRKGRADLVFAADTAVELGHPSTESAAVVLTTERPGVVRRNRVSILGPDFAAAAAGERWSFGQVVMVELKPGARPDPFDLDSTQYLINRLPGYMVRSVPGRLWVRVSKAGLSSGLDLERVAASLISAYEGGFPEVQAVEVAFVTRERDRVASLAPVALEARVISGRHKKLALSADGEIECSELNCQTCDEQEVCDDLRDVVRERQRRISG